MLNKYERRVIDRTAGAIENLKDNIQKVYNILVEKGTSELLEALDYDFAGIISNTRFINELIKSVLYYNDKKKEKNNVKLKEENEND